MEINKKRLGLAHFFKKKSGKRLKKQGIIFFSHVPVYGTGVIRLCVCVFVWENHEQLLNGWTNLDKKFRA